MTGGKKPQTKPKKKKSPVKQTEKRKLCFEYFKKGNFNRSFISQETGLDRHTVADYEKVYLSEVRDTSSFIEREQDARDGLVLFLENYITDTEKGIEEVQAAIDSGKGGKAVGMLYTVISNMKRDMKETIKEIASLKMTPLTEDKIEQALTEKYGIKQPEKPQLVAS